MYTTRRQSIHIAIGIPSGAPADLPGSNNSNSWNWNRWLGIFSFLMLFITTLTAISTLVVLQLLNSGIQEANKSWFYLTIALDILAICAVLSVSETGRHRKRWSISSAILSIVCCLMQLWVCKMILNAPMIISLISSLITEESVTIQLA